MAARIFRVVKRPLQSRAGLWGRAAAGSIAAFLFAMEPTQAQTKIVVNQAAQSLSAAAVYLAYDLGYFEKEGLAVSFIPTGSGMKSISPLLSGDAQYCICSFSHPIDALQAGAGEVRIIGQILTGFNQKIVLSKAVALERKITSDLPLAERVAALKGLKIGVTEPNASTDQAVRIILQSYNINPSKEAVLIALGALNLPPALQNRQIDAFDMSPPIPEMSVEAGDAIVLVDIGKDKIPLLSTALNLAITVDQAYLAKNRDTAMRFVRAIATAQTYLAEKPEEARTILKQKDFPKMEQRSFDLAFDANRSFYAKSPAIVRQDVDAGLELARRFTRGAFRVTYEQIVDTSIVTALSK